MEDFCDLFANHVASHVPSPVRGVTPRINSGSRCTRRRHTRTTRPLGASVHPRTEQKSAIKGEMLRGSLPAPLSRPSPPSLAPDTSLPPGAGAMGYVDIANTHPRSTLPRNATRPRPFAIFHLCIISVKL